MKKTCWPFGEAVPEAENIAMQEAAELPVVSVAMIEKACFEADYSLACVFDAPLLFLKESEGPLPKGYGHISPAQKTDRLFH